MKLISLFLIVVLLAVVCGATSPKVLIVMPSLNYLTLVGGVQVQVGYYLDEFYWTAQALASAKYDVIITTPEGISLKSPLDIDFYK